MDEKLKLQKGIIVLLSVILFALSCMSAIFAFELLTSEDDSQEFETYKEYYQPATDLYDKMIKSCGEGYAPQINTIDLPDGTFMLNIECVQSQSV